jgi:lipoate-protein ligase A
MPQNAEQIDRDPGRQLAADWELFQAVELGIAEVRWRCWESPAPVVVIGRHGAPAADIFQERCSADRVPVLRRFSGGGAVVLGPGCVNFAVVFSLGSRPEFVDVEQSFAIILDAIASALDVPGLARADRADLAVAGRKVSGNAQRRGRRALIHHGTLLYDFDPQLAARYLREPGRQPAYRARRPHAEFIGNLPLGADTVRARLERACGLLCTAGEPSRLHRTERMHEA